MFFHESSYPQVFWRLNRNFTGDKIAMARIWENEGTALKKTWKYERKVLLTSKNFKTGSWIAGPLPCTGVLWGQKMKKNKKIKKLPLFKDGCIFFLSNLLSSWRRRFSCYWAILLLLYFAGTHDSMTCHESSDWRRVVTILYFCWLLQTSNPCKRLWSGEDLQIKVEAPLTDPASGIPEAQNLWVHQTIVTVSRLPPFFTMCETF